MKVKDLIQKLQELPEDMNIKYISGVGEVADLEVYFEQENIMNRSGYTYKAVIMKGEY